VAALLLESPRFLLALAVLVETVLFLTWFFTRFRDRPVVKPLWLLVGPIVAAAAVLLDICVETDREQLDQAARSLVRATQEEDVAATISLLSDNLRLDNGLDKAGASAVIAYYLAKPLIATNSIDKLAVTAVQRPRGCVELAVTTNIDLKCDYAVLLRLVRTTWRLDYVWDTDGRCRLTNLTMLSFNGGKPFDVFTHRFQ